MKSIKSLPQAKEYKIVDKKPDTTKYITKNTEGGLFVYKNINL